VRIITLTNGSAAMSERMFTDGGIMPLLEHRLDVSVPGRWKPHRAAYRYAADVCGVAVERMALVAVHPWDIDGCAPGRTPGVLPGSSEDAVPEGFPGT